MQRLTNQALHAIKSECHMPTLEQVIKRLKAEKAMVEAELNRMPADSWFNVRGRELMNREQELHVTLGVLERLTTPPKQIEEPHAAAR